MSSYAVITGASSGIGYDLAKAFAAKGRNIIIAARREDRLIALKEEIARVTPDCDIVVRRVDLADNTEKIDFYNSLAVYPISVWVNNAGRGNKGDITAGDIDVDLNMLHINVDAVAPLSSLYVRDYKDAEGAVLLNISSIGGYLIVPGATLYCATKFFVSALSEGINHEMIANGHKLRSKELAPTSTATEFEQTANALSDPVDYSTLGRPFFTSGQMAEFAIKLVESDKVVGEIDIATHSLKLSDPHHPHL